MVTTRSKSTSSRTVSTDPSLPLTMSSDAEGPDPFDIAIKDLTPGSAVTVETIVALFKAQRESLQKYDVIINTQAKQIEELQTHNAILEDKVDALEQYGRRNAIRIRGVPAPENFPNNEDTDSIVMQLAKDKLGVSLLHTEIVRSHRVGQKKDIIVKLVTHNKKVEIMKARKKLKDSDLSINEDLSQVRGKLAFLARGLKRKKKIQDTWTRDGVIFIKLTDDSVKRCSTESQYETVISDIQ